MKNNTFLLPKYRAVNTCFQHVLINLPRERSNKRTIGHCYFGLGHLCQVHSKMFVSNINGNNKQTGRSIINLKNLHTISLNKTKINLKVYKKKNLEELVDRFKHINAILKHFELSTMFYFLFMLFFYKINLPLRPNDIEKKHTLILDFKILIGHPGHSMSNHLIALNLYVIRRCFIDAQASILIFFVIF